MEIKNCLILSAGRGTRMGEVGTVLPKVVWPVFEKSLLEMQIAYAKELGCKNIFVNTYHLSERVKEQIKKLNDPSIIILHEEELLGSGGPIHNVIDNSNVAAEDYLLTLNCDHFLFSHKKEWLNFKKRAAGNAVTMLGIPVKKEAGYNQINVEDNKFLGVVKNSSAPENFLTYSGISIIKVDKIRRVEGPSAFFETVANYKERSVGVHSFDKYEEWDFGTSRRYIESIFKLLVKYDEDTLMSSFCKRNSVLDENKIDKASLSYGTPNRNICNFTAGDISITDGPSVIIEGSPKNRKAPGIYFCDLFSKLDS